ncbi:tripeptidyl-peptidase 1 [Xylariaceae sp. FL0255]|nr:tripeptidyl-peptidase 1 [Xylariaceae sp. FL0255]
MRSLATALFATAATAKLMDFVPSVPKGWKEVGEPALSEPIALKIALPQRHADALEQAVIEMSTPGHANYGKHMDPLELRSYTAPTEKTLNSVLDWLSQSNIKTSVNNDWITITTTVEKANELLNTKFLWYQYEKSAKPVLRTLEYSIPDELATDIDLIQPTTRFGQMGSHRSTIFSSHVLGPIGDEKGSEDVAAATCNGNQITPACIKSLYSIGYTAKATGNLVGFCSYLDEYARYTDLQSFEEKWATAAIGQNFSVTEINGGLNDQTSSDDSGEANLDVQYILGVSNPIPIIEYSTGGLGPLVPTEDEPGPTSSNEPYLDFLTWALNQTNLPQTLSTSYGEEEQSVPADYAVKICNMFMQLGALGVSVIFSSGDSGPGDSCVRQSDGAPWFQPTFPGACPYVTSVGATKYSSSESAATFSSGGFSDLHARPSWQNAAVSAYLTSIGSTYSKYYNATGRGFPDVSALGQDFAVVDKGSSTLLSGTSASSPTFAGTIALLNAARKSAGLSGLGFLNPWLYNNSAALTDIKSGYSSGCTSNKAIGGARWNATTGWDPVTGLGTPNFAKMLAIAAPGVANS